MKHTFKTILALLIISTVTLISCNEKEQKPTGEKFTLTGKLLTPYSDTIFFSYGSKKDCTVIKNNTFRFEGTLDSIDQGEAFLHLKTPGNLGVIFLDKGNITVDFDYITKEIDSINYTFLQTKKVEGSLNHKIWDNYSAFWRKNHKKNNYGDLIMQQLKKKIDSFPESPILGRILHLNSDSVLNTSQIKEIKSLIDTTTMYSNDLRIINITLNTKKRTQKGTPVKNFTLKNAEGKTENFYTPNNKFTIVDFWASWCGPCRRENKKLPELAKKYGDKLEIITISIDDEENEWKKAIEKDGLIWKNYITENDWDSEICDYYGITSIPSKILIDKNGNFLGYNLSYDQIDAILEKE